MSKTKNAKPLTGDKKQILKKLIGSASSKIDFNKVRDWWKNNEKITRL